MLQRTPSFLFQAAEACMLPVDVQARVRWARAAVPALLRAAQDLHLREGERGTAAHSREVAMAWRC